jgi:hypothetical protein
MQPKGPSLVPSDASAPNSLCSLAHLDANNTFQLGVFGRAAPDVAALGGPLRLFHYIIRTLCIHGVAAVGGAVVIKKPWLYQSGTIYRERL